MKWSSQPKFLVHFNLTIALKTTITNATPTHTEHETKIAADLSSFDRVAILAAASSCVDEVKRPWAPWGWQCEHQVRAHPEAPVRSGHGCPGGGEGEGAAVEVSLTTSSH